MAREIPSTAVEIQEGLWLDTKEVVINGTTYIQRRLYSSEGYCFYDTELDEYDEEGNLIQRNYYQYMMIGNPNKSLDTIHSILIEEGMEIAGGTGTPEIA